MTDGGSLRAWAAAKGFRSFGRALDSDGLRGKPGEHWSEVVPRFQTELLGWG